MQDSEGRGSDGGGVGGGSGGGGKIVADGISTITQVQIVMHRSRSCTLQYWTHGVLLNIAAQHR